jgi:hypothetical protein
MPSLLDENMFAQMSMLDKLKTLGSGAVSSASLLFNNPSAYLEHGAYPEQLKNQLSAYKDLGTTRINRSPLDMAINYGGGYQFGTIPDMTVENADKMAKAWQLMDYMKASNPKSELDAWKDYQENMAGVRAAVQARNSGKQLTKDEIAKASANYGRLYK